MTEIEQFMLNRVKVHPYTQTSFFFFSPIGGLLSITSGVHGGSVSVESRDGGEELSTPAVKHKCVHSEDSVSLMSDLGVCKKIVRQ